jgi:hypothetical protein
MSDSGKLARSLYVFWNDTTVSKMPYKSLAQERYFNANRGKLEAQGVNIDEWNAASKGKKLPARVKSRGVLGQVRQRKKRPPWK